VPGFDCGRATVRNGSTAPVQRAPGIAQDRSLASPTKVPRNRTLLRGATSNSGLSPIFGAHRVKDLRAEQGGGGRCSRRSRSRQHRCNALRSGADQHISPCESIANPRQLIRHGLTERGSASRQIELRLRTDMRVMFCGLQKYPAREQRRPSELCNDVGIIQFRPD
jgi:hypothetical protein